jgi:hypothetical protein
MEVWSTPEEIAAARNRLEQALRWRRPAAYGVGRVARPPESPQQVDDVADGLGLDVTFTRINVGEHYLPAAVLATVLGHRSGSAVYPMTRQDLQRAVELLAPVQACGAFDHPNLLDWREILADTDVDAGDVVAVFVEDLEQPGDHPYVRSLLEAARSVTADVEE